MKHFLLILSMLCALESFAQDPQLLENTWYLEFIVISGEELPPPGEEGEATVIPMDISLVDFNTVVCDSHACSEIDFIGGNDSFTLNSCVTGILGCEFNENEAYQNLYFYDFFNADFPPNTFDYSITTVGDKKTLTLTSSDGDQAIYSNQLLAVEDQQLVDINIFPNPVTDILKLSTPINELISIHIYNINGQNVANFENKTQGLNEINIAGLDSSIYFLIVRTDNGLLTKRIIKE